MCVDQNSNVTLLVWPTDFVSSTRNFRPRMNNTPAAPQSLQPIITPIITRAPSAVKDPVVDALGSGYAMTSQLSYLG